MRALWHCPTCGKKFSRRWNAERHITEVHKTTARPIKLEQDSSYKEEFEVKQNPQEFVSQHRQNASEYRIVIGFPELNNHSWMSRAQMIIDRVIEAYPNDLKIELYNGRSDGYGSLSMDHNKIIGYRGIVCEKCLSIALLEISIGNGHEFVEHRC